MDVYAGPNSSKKTDRKGKQVHAMEEHVDKGIQTKLTKGEVNALLAVEQKKWEKGKLRK